MELAELIAKQEIHEVLMRFLRSMDRQEWEAVRSCFHPGAVHDHGTWRGSIDEFIEREKATYGQFSSNTHLGGNELIEIDGDTARCELYSVCWHRLKGTPQRPEEDSVNGMRYLDKFECRGGEWRIVDRLVVLDWQRVDPVSMRTGQ
jgi:hypothetical protein